MTSHPYLDLQQGNVENYCMMVPKAEEPQWYEQGWLPHYAVGLSRREANRASMVYGFMRFKRDVLLFARPEYLAAKSPIGRKIVGFSTHLGTYGMGGPGFFGLLLDTDELGLHRMARGIQHAAGQPRSRNLPIRQHYRTRLDRQFERSRMGRTLAPGHRLRNRRLHPRRAPLYPAAAKRRPNPFIGIRAPRRTHLTHS